MQQKETSHELKMLKKAREDLLTGTEEGAIVHWTERIAQTAVDIGLDPRYLNWQGSPNNVAHTVIEAAINKYGADGAAETIKNHFSSSNEEGSST